MEIKANQRQPIPKIMLEEISEPLQTRKAVHNFNWSEEGHFSWQ